MHIEFLSFQQLRNNPSNFFNKISSFYEIELPKKLNIHQKIRMSTIEKVMIMSGKVLMS